jgi:ferric-dicitrate binding protein FerR (iron transport regulator)
MPADLPLNDAQAPISRRALEQAAAWFVCLRSGSATDRDLQRWRAWCAAAHEHQLAWQRAEALANRLTRLEGSGSTAARVLKTSSAPMPARRRAARTLGLAAAGLGLGWIVYQSDQRERWLAAHSTPTGERRQWLLADGSRVLLDGASAFDVAFDAQRRLLKLRQGQMLIETAHDPRPLIVATAQGEVQALGTRFSVRQEASASVVDLYAGMVEVRPTRGRAALLHAGDAVSFTDTLVDAVQATATSGPMWARGLIVANDMPLNELVAQLSRYRHGHLGCSPAVAPLRISGVFSLDDTDAAVAAIARTLPVRVLRVTPYWTRLDAR